MVFSAENLQKEQLIQPEIAKECKRICEKHGIPFFYLMGLY